MNIGIIGDGGREAALEEMVRRSPFVQKVVRLEGGPQNTSALLHKAIVDSIDFTIVGSEAYLANGIVDLFGRANRKIFGPTKAAARIETSKAWCRQLLRHYGVPSPAFWVFHDPQEVKAFIRKQRDRMVVKIDGLAAGKGVIVGRDIDHTLMAVDHLVRLYPGQPLVLEEFLPGPECSYMVLTDGMRAVPLLAAQDTKEAWPGGPNTGGMLAYAPFPLMTRRMEKRILESIIHPTLVALRKEGCPFHGVLYAGLKFGPQGPVVIEFNARLGDPEFQALSMLCKTDLVPAMYATTNNSLTGFSLQWKNQAAVCVVLASRGYPSNPEVGYPIKGLENAARIPHISILHAGTKLQEDGTYITTKGRVLNIIACAPRAREAYRQALEAASHISFEGMWYRGDLVL